MTDQDIQMRARRLPFPVLDADNHMYETADALTKFLPPEYEGVIGYVTNPKQSGGRLRLVVKDRLSNIISNPTFERVAPPGAYDDDIKGQKRARSIVSDAAFFDPEPRLALMREMGIDRAVIWPTLACNVEERLVDDPVAMHVVVHAFNQWMDEHWGFNYEDGLFAAPMITVPIVDRAIKELEWVVERGARAFFIRPGPVPGLGGFRSFALPEFDPFWEAVQDADIVVGMHVGDNGHQRYLNDWEGTRGRAHGDPGAMSAFAALIASRERVFTDAVASMIGHGMLTRFPRLKILPVEWSSGSWVRPFVEKLKLTSEQSARLFVESPIEVFNRNVYVHSFRDPDPVGLIKLVGADRCVFGSDFPHPEGLGDPISFIDQIEVLPVEDQRKVMGGNLAGLLKVA
jgi:predicted TIM-barrel fold metal-dependent hydrolase